MGTSLPNIYDREWCRRKGREDPAARNETAVHVLHERKAWDKQTLNKIKPSATYMQSKGPSTICRNCGKSHQPRQCPAYGATCNKCGKQNHYARMCRTGQTRKTVHEIDTELDGLFIGTVRLDQLQSRRDKSWFSSIKVDNMPVEFKLDTGAEANVLPLKVFNSMARKTRREKSGKFSLKPTKTVLIAYGGARLEPEGTLTLTCSTSKAQADLTFYVSRHSTVAILGREACEELSLIKRVDIDTLAVKHPATKEELISQHPSVFNGLGEFDGEYHIHTDPNVAPVIQWVRKVFRPL